MRTALNMITIYLLQLDKDQIRRVQEATKTTKEWGIEPTHGVYGYEEWWDNIRNGTLPVHRVKGTITRGYNEGPYRDQPVFDMRTKDGKEYTWEQHANDSDYADLYTVGRYVEVDYVIQRMKRYVAGLNPQHEIVIEVRVAMD
jgi:hypothetical protein